MMKIRYALLLSVSCLGFGSLAHAGLISDITPVGKNTFISTQRGAPAGESPLLVVLGIEKALGLSHPPVNEQEFSCTSYTHLASQSKLLSASVIARRTSSDEAIHSYFYGSPRRINSPRDDTDDLLDSTAAQSARSAFHAPINQQQKIGSNGARLASVCFITDAGNCRGDDFGGAGMDNPNSSGGNDPEWDLDNKERCNKEGYTLTSCSSVQDPVNFCPYDNHFFEKCVCKPNLVTCTKPYYGVGESCGGKYASCKLDNARACKEDGYSQTGSCNSVQNINKRCPYDSNYFDKCVCRSDLYTCSSPLQGIGTVCGGKYASCQCPSSYQTCSCGAAAGASSCTWGGTTKYSSCKKCCSDTCPSGSKSVSCYAGQRKVKVSTTECGSSCYRCQSSASQSPSSGGWNSSSSSSSSGSYSSSSSSSSSSSGSYNSDCSVTSKSCDYGCAKTNSCNKCIECKSKPQCTSYFYYCHDSACGTPSISDTCGSQHTDCRNKGGSPVQKQCFPDITVTNATFWCDCD